VSRGEYAHRAASIQGERPIEFLSAGGVAMTLLELGDIGGAARWLDLAATAASMAPSRPRARQLETWRGMVRARAGDADGMLRHLEHAVATAAEGGRASARCEALARLAIEAARSIAPGGSDDSAAASAADDDVPDAAIGELVALVERSAAQAKELLPLLPGHAPWGAQVDAALATVALRRGDLEAAALAGGAALQALEAALHEDTSLEIVLPAARAILAGGPPDVQESVRAFLRSTLSRIAQGTADEAIRVRWLTGPVGRELIALAGPVDALAPAAATDGGPSLDEGERRLLQLLTEGRTNAEIASELDFGEDDVAQRLARLQARLGTSSRAGATSLAFQGLAAVGSR
jgi:DNA-binding NarL/FixJ family response regulator